MHLQLIGSKCFPIALHLAAFNKHAVGVGVGVTVSSGVGVGVGVTVCSGVGVGVGVTVSSGDGVGVGVTVSSGYGVGVGVSVISSHLQYFLLNRTILGSRPVFRQ